MERRSVQLAVTVTAFLLLLSSIAGADPTQGKDDDHIVIDGERTIFVRLEFAPGSMELTEASEKRFADIVPLLTDGTLRRYELHGNFCVGISGTRRNAMARAEAVFERLTKNGVSENDITTTLNVAYPTHNRVCPAELRIDVMATELRREERKPVVQGRRTVAVYMAGDEPEGARGVHNIIGGELTRAISANQKFLAVDRTDFILEQLAKEHVYQRGGAVDDEQIIDLGKQLGVQYLCISNIIAVGTGFYIDTRLVDVETAEVIRSITATSSLRDVNEYMRVARDIARELVEPDRSHRCGSGEDSKYDPVYQFCFGGRAYNFCGGSGYNPRTQGCLPNNEIGTLCADGTIVALGTHCGKHTLSVAVAPQGGGSVIRSPEAETYGADQTVALSAVANRGFEFAGWAGAQSSSEPAINVTMTRNMPVIAMFKPDNNNALITTAFPAEGGTITRDPEHEEYSSNETVTVTAVANKGFEFVGWEGAASDTSSKIEVQMNEGKALVAIFRPNLHTLSATSLPDFGGSVFINGTALMEATSSEVGNKVEAYARPARGYLFKGWSGDAEGADNPAIIDLTSANVNIIANFAPEIIAEEEAGSRIIAVGGGAELAPVPELAQDEIKPTAEPDISGALAPQTSAPRSSRFKLAVRYTGATLAVGGVVGGLIYNGMAQDEYDKYRAYNSESDIPEIENSRKKTEDHISTRDLLYILGGIGLSGFAITFFF